MTAVERETIQAVEMRRSIIITTEIGGRYVDMVVPRDAVAVQWDDNLDRWVAIRGDGERRLLSGRWGWMEDGNAIDEAAEAFGVEADEVVVDMRNI